MSVEVVGFDKLIETYEDCPDFGVIYAAVKERQSKEFTDFLIQDGYLFMVADFVSHEHPLETSLFGSYMQVNWPVTLTEIRLLRS
ncbi:hypothetical protein AXF42_Ash002913 [Apostasia shenzhenica]|uniref:Uncharacterized protein n=1 Tax=Apostasia shenzhenica TaxID=1088818 RepID=A0A2I0A7M1_9ASPA|nr:hypothetical protein AXF42_Ash002913 [Apostasia shenzhenica]